MWCTCDERTVAGAACAWHAIARVRRCVTMTVYDRLELHCSNCTRKLTVSWWRGHRVVQSCSSALGEKRRRRRRPQQKSVEKQRVSDRVCSRVSAEHCRQRLSESAEEVAAADWNQNPLRNLLQMDAAPIKPIHTSHTSIGPGLCFNFLTFSLWALSQGLASTGTIQIGHGKNIQHGKNYLCYVSVLTFQKGPLTRHNSLNTQISRMCRKGSIHL